jgi:hypothetical protein
MDGSGRILWTFFEINVIQGQRQEINLETDAGTEDIDSLCSNFPRVINFYPMFGLVP